jgi:erythronate-4-phosphate dehydrogenase
MATADALVTRTRVKCDAALLAGSRCRFIATATIGTDHIDLDYCRQNGITVANAPGCNAPAVAQWVLATALSRTDDPRGTVIGIVGVGHVGSIVDRWARSLGFTTLLCDPPRQGAGQPGFVSLARIAAEADIITFHTPLTRGGLHPTFHLADADFFDSCRRRPMVMNAARGPVTDTEALIRALETGTASAAAIDCWEGEPAISPRLLELATVATPHIAGYSLQGKIRATQMSLDALSTFFSLPRLKADSEPALRPKNAVTATEMASSYNPALDTAALKAHPEMFERLRDTYNLRREP